MLTRGFVAKFEYLVDGLDAGGIGTNSVDDDFSRKAIGCQHPGEELRGDGFVAPLE